MGELVLRLATLPVAPFAYAQGRRVRASMPPPCAAAGHPHGVAGHLRPGPHRRLLVLGESTAAGCGIATQDEALAAHVAAALAERVQAPVAWRAIGCIGITARRAARELEAAVADEPQADVAVIALGVNDVLGQTSARAFVADLMAVVAMVQRHHGRTAVVLAGVPPVGAFPALPQPLRGLLGWRARRLDRAAWRHAKAAGLVYVPTRLDGNDRALFAADGFHPSSAGCAVWGRALVQAAPLGGSS